MAERSPTLTVALLLVGVYLVEFSLALLGTGPGVFALTTPVLARPWTLVTSVYAHYGLGHLFANLVGLLVVGFVLERRTSPARFHAFFLATGVVAGLAQVWVSDLFGPPSAVLGASGAIFGLVGYVLAGNRVADSVLSHLPLSAEAQLVVFAVVAAGLTLLTSGPRVALVAHFTGLLIGLLTGRAHLLRE